MRPKRRAGCAILSRLSWAEMKDMPYTVEVSMRYVLRLSALLAGLVISSAHASDRACPGTPGPGRASGAGPARPVASDPIAAIADVDGLPGKL